MNIEEFFEKQKEKTPDWLQNFEVGGEVPAQQILDTGRVVYCPGAYENFQFLGPMIRSRYAHIFLYAYHMLPEESARRYLSAPHAFPGYHLLELRPFAEQELVPHGWRPHYRPTQKAMDAMKGVVPFGLLGIYESDPGGAGCDRFALLWLGGDAFATYDALYVNGSRRLDVLYVQDRGFDGNYDSFGRGGLLERLSGHGPHKPRYLLCTDRSAVWRVYEKVAAVEPAESDRDSQRWEVYVLPERGG